MSKVLTNQCVRNTKSQLLAPDFFVELLSCYYHCLYMFPIF
jgi:hypothetical protein